MLTELNVNQFAIIDKLNIQFKQGLNIISGETGAGKSVLLRSLSLLMGAKASSDFIRSGASQAQIEGRFDLMLRPDLLTRLESLDIPLTDHELIVRRIIGPGDKNKVYLNGCLSTVGVLREIVAPLIEVAGKNAPLIELTGQHENKNLLTKSYHLDLLDQFAKTWPLRNQYELLWNDYTKNSELIKNLESKSATSQQQLDFLIFQRDEIKQISFNQGDEIELELKVKKLKNKQRLLQFLYSTLESLDNEEDSILLRLQKILQRGQEFASFDSQLAEKLKILEQAHSLVQDCHYELSKSMEALDSEEEDAEALEAKLSQWRKLQKKFGSDFHEIQRSLQKIETEIAEIQNAESMIQLLRKKQQELMTQILQEGKKLHDLRKAATQELIIKVNEHLQDLNMKGVTFDIQVNLSETPLASGMTDIEFLSQTSPQDPPRPLAKVASGGELSRILLSLKCVLGTSTFPRTYLFDEVDTGVSGVTADKVARKLHQISAGQQVICVTHLPQVAALGDHHFCIQKSPTGKFVHMEVTLLEGNQRIREIARLISGEKITTTSLAHAKELLSTKVPRTEAHQGSKSKLMKTTEM